MGQRLNIEIKINSKVRANAYYHWSGYTESAKELAKNILKEAQRYNVKENPTVYAIKLLEVTKAGLTNTEIKIAKEKYPEVEFAKATDRNSGLIAISDKGIKETRTWEEARVTLDFDKQIVKFNVWFKETLNEYIKWHEEKPEFTTSTNPLYMTFDYFLSDFCERNTQGYEFLYKNFVYSSIY